MKFEKEIMYFNKEVENSLKNAKVKGIYNSEDSLYLLLEKKKKNKKNLNVIISYLGKSLLVNAPAGMRYGITNFIYLESIANSIFHDLMINEFLYINLLEIYDTAKKPQSFAFFAFPLPIEEEFPLTPISEKTVSKLSEKVRKTVIQRLKKNEFTNNFTEEELNEPENLFNFLYGIPYKNIYDLSKIKKTDVKEILESDVGRLAQMVHFFKDEEGFDTRFYGEEDTHLINTQNKSKLSFISGIRTILKKKPEIEKEIINLGIHKKIINLESELSKSLKINYDFNEDFNDFGIIEDYYIDLIYSNKNKIKGIKSDNSHVKFKLQEFYLALYLISWIVDNKFEENKIGNVNIQKLNLKAKDKVSSIKKYLSFDKAEWKNSIKDSEWKTVLKRWKETEEIDVQILPYEDSKREINVEVEVTPYEDIFKDIEVKVTEKGETATVEFVNDKKQKLNEKNGDKKLEEKKQNKESNKVQERIQEQKKVEEKYNEIKEIFFEKRLKHFAFFLNKNNDSWLFGVEGNNIFFTNSDINFQVAQYYNIDWFEFFIITRNSGVSCPFHITTYERLILEMLHKTASWKESRKELYSRERSQKIDVLAENPVFWMACNVFDFAFIDNENDSKNSIFDISNLVKKPLKGDFSLELEGEQKEKSNLLPHICGFYENKEKKKTVFNTLIKSDKFYYSDIFYIILDLADKLKNKQLKNDDFQNEKIVEGNMINLTKLVFEQSKLFQLEPWQILITRFYWYDLRLMEDEKDYTIKDRQIFFDQNYKKRYNQFVSEAWRRYKAFEEETLRMVSSTKISSITKEEDLYLLFTILSRTIIINIIRKFNKYVLLYQEEPLDENDSSTRDEYSALKLIKRSINYLLKNISIDLSKEQLQKLKKQLFIISRLYLTRDYETWLSSPEEFIETYEYLKFALQALEQTKKEKQTQSEKSKKETIEQELTENDEKLEEEVDNEVIRYIEENIEEVKEKLKLLSEEEKYKWVMSTLINFFGRILNLEIDFDLERD